MPDFFDRKDLSAVTDFSDPNAKFVFEFDATEQTFFNETNDTVFEISWDGRNVHSRSDPKNETRTIIWTDHLRRVIFVRRVLGTGGMGEKLIQVHAITR